MFKSDRVYVDGQLEALKLRVEWLENELKYQAESGKTRDKAIASMHAAIEAIINDYPEPVS